jgi:hypothetical protein
LRKLNVAQRAPDSAVTIPLCRTVRVGEAQDECQSINDFRGIRRIASLRSLAPLGGPSGVKGVSFQSPFEVPAFFGDDCVSSYRRRGASVAPYFAKLCNSRDSPARGMHDSAGHRRASMAHAATSRPIRQSQSHSSRYV